MIAGLSVCFAPVAAAPRGAGDRPAGHSVLAQMDDQYEDYDEGTPLPEEEMPARGDDEDEVPPEDRPPDSGNGDDDGLPEEEMPSPENDEDEYPPEDTLPDEGKYVPGYGPQKSERSA